MGFFKENWVWIVANRAGSDRLRLGRWMIDGSTPLHHLVTEACGGFELLRRLGIDLVE